MFLLNNIHERNYSELYASFRDVAFDISESQLKSKKNHDWVDIAVGSIVCVVNGTRKISTFRRITEKPSGQITDTIGERAFLIIGPVVGKLVPDVDMTTVLNRYGVDHIYLPRNVFSVGFNVANLGNSLDAMTLTTKDGTKTLADLKLAN